MIIRLLLAAVGTCALSVARAADPDPCTHFKWDVMHERVVMQATPLVVMAAAKPADETPQLQLDKLYELRLSPQSGVTFAGPPGKASSAYNAYAGLALFRSDKAGRYRVAMTTPHWVDFVDGKKVIASIDFNGVHDCERPRKVVEFDLPARRDLTLQLSAASEKTVLIAVTFVPH